MGKFQSPRTGYILSSPLFIFLSSCLLPCIILLLLLLLHTASSFKSLLSSQRSNRIYHRSPMQTEISQLASQRIMPETRCTSFPALSVYPRIGISRLHRRPMIDYFSYLLLNKIILILQSFYNLRCMTANSERHTEFFVTAR